MKSLAPLFSMLLASCAPISAALATPIPAQRTTKPAKLAGKIAFASVRGGKSGISVMNADGTHQTLLVSDEYYGLPSFSADGKQISVVTWNRPDTNPTIHLINADGSNERFLTYLWRVEGSYHPSSSFSPDGKQIAFTRNDGKEEIYVTSADGKGEIALTKGNRGTGHIYPNSFSPSYSPDGKQIVFVSDRVFNSNALGSSNEIFVMNTDGTAQTRITHNDDDDGSPCFSPDGKQIAFTSVCVGKSQIWVMNADGTGAVQLTQNGAADPCFSPDGKHLAYTSGSDWKAEIYVMNLDGTHQKKLTDGSRPTWAPGFVPAPTLKKTVAGGF